MNRAAEKAPKRFPSQAAYLRTTLIQVLAVVIVIPIAYGLLGKAAAVSLACGAACAVIPQGFFALRMATAARQSAARAARLGLAAEGGKFLLSAAAFALVFAVVKPAQPGLVFLGFGVFWLVQLIDGVRLLRAR